MHTPPSSAASGPNPETPLRLLLVDDNDLDALKITRAVSGLGLAYEVQRALDGLEALEAMRSDPAPTLVLLDLQMPRMNGFELLEARDEDPSLWSIPVFVLSTSARECDIQRCHRSRIAGYLVKPASIPEMQELIGIAIRFWSRCRHAPPDGCA